MTFNLLVIPDVHAHPKDDFARIDALHSFLGRPGYDFDHMLIMGDVWDMESLCSHDEGKTAWHSRRFDKDIEAGQEAMRRLLNIADDHNVDAVDFLEGNHEDRLRRWAGEDARVGSSIGPNFFRELFASDYADVDFHDFLDILELGVGKTRLYASHYFTSGLMGRAVSGVQPAYNLIKTQFESCIQAHKHTFDYAEYTKANGEKVQGVVAGCFVDPRKDFSYAKTSKKLWWNGVLMLRYSDRGQGFDLEQISIERMMEAA